MDNVRQIQLEVEEAREMTDAEVESVASLLFNWWKRDFEAEEQPALVQQEKK